MSKPKVFISYTFSDKGWAQEFANSLKQHGLRVWFDSSAVLPGESWKEAVEKGLRESNVIALLVTPDTIQRPNFFFEIGAAMGMRKRLIPVVSKEVDLDVLPSLLRERRYLIKDSPEATAQAFASEAIVSHVM